MNTKDYLKQIKVLDIKIKQLEEQVVRLKTLAMSPKGMSINNNPGGKKSVISEEDRLNKLVVEYIDLEQKAAMLKKQLEATRSEIIGQIQRLEDVRYIDVLYRRYVKFESYERIAREMAYSMDHVKLIHRQALEKLEEKLEEL